ncbi:MAG: hypothetical protein ACLFSC_02315 [Wenzhouxiangella sp.]
MSEDQHNPAKQSAAQRTNLGLILLFYLALALTVWLEIPAWMELLGLRSQSAGGGAAMIFLFAGLPIFLVACLLFLVTALLPRPSRLQSAHNYRKLALLILLAWHIAFFLLEPIVR